MRLNKSELLSSLLKKIFFGYIYCLVLMALARVFFVLYFAEHEVYAKYFSDLLSAFYVGARYDTMAISYLLLPILLITFIFALSPHLIFARFVNMLTKVWFLLVSIIIVFFSICDFAFYSFFQDHLNTLFFGLVEDDTTALLKSIWQDYPLGKVLIGVLLLSIFTWTILGKIFRPVAPVYVQEIKGHKIQKIGMMLLTLILYAGGIRGGYGEMVLAPQYADFSRSEFVNTVPLNGLITFEKALKLRLGRQSGKKMSDYMGYKNNINQAFMDYLEVNAYEFNNDFKDLYKTTTAKSYAPMHVIVIVMESLGSYWLQFNSEKFNLLGGLEKHFAEDYFFPNFISADNGTIGSLMAVATTIPMMPGVRFLSEGDHMQLSIDSSMHMPFKKQGFETSFIYGGKLGWRGIGKYFRHQGYDLIEGEEHIKYAQNVQKNIGTDWGIFDEYLFSHIYSKLKNATKPQFILAMSTTNHPPYDVNPDYKKLPLQPPSELKDKIIREHEIVDERFTSYQYANYHLSQLIDKIKNSDLAANTIIAVTGDHNFWSFINYDESEYFNRYTVPFYLYFPTKLRPANVNLNVIGSHEDIAGTVINLALSETSYLSFGEDLLSSSKMLATNSKLYADESGFVYNNNFYAWKELGKTYTDGVKETPLVLDRNYRSVLTVADFYLDFINRLAGANNDRR